MELSVSLLRITVKGMAFAKILEIVRVDSTSPASEYLKEFHVFPVFFHITYSSFFLFAVRVYT